MELGERDAAEVVLGEELLSLLLLESLLPVQGRELEEPLLGPSGEETEEVAEVAPGLDAVQLAARQERDEDGVDLAGVIVAGE